ncbi:MAG: hypothetical protein JWR74_2844 [Polaromonas sp.]|nr:hypothetical protein [Polaromonas sp.]
MALQRISTVLACAFRSIALTEHLGVAIELVDAQAAYIGAMSHIQTNRATYENGARTISAIPKHALGGDSAGPLECIELLVHTLSSDGLVGAAPC